MIDIYPPLEVTIEALPHTASLASIAGFLKAIRLFPFPGRLPDAEPKPFFQCNFNTDDDGNPDYDDDNFGMFRHVVMNDMDAIHPILEKMTTMLAASTQLIPESTTVSAYMDSIKVLDDDYAWFIFDVIANNEHSSPPRDSLVSVLRQLAYTCASLPLNYPDSSPVQVRELVHFIAFQPLNATRPLCPLSPFQLSVLIDTKRSASIDFDMINEIRTVFMKHPGQWVFNSIDTAHAFDDDDHDDALYEACMATQTSLVIFRYCKCHLFIIFE